MDPTAQPPGALLRFDLPCSALGIEPPPVSVQVRFLADGRDWSLVLLVPAGRASDAAAWAQRQAPMEIQTAPGLAPRVLRCKVHEMPPQWLGWLTAVRVVQVDIAAHGMAVLFVKGDPDQLVRLAASLADAPTARHRLYATQPLELVPITRRQLEALSNAVALGYYDVPHRVNLRQLGKSMGLSVSAVSQLLRRAQAQVIRSFVDANTLALGQGMTEPDTPALPPKGA